MIRQLPLKLSLDRHARLEDYVGEASSALQALPGLVVLAGAAGTGKSHLLQGLCRRVIEDDGKAIYLGSLSQLAPTVLEGLESARVICLDDVDAIIKDPAWQLALFHLVNACRDAGRKLVIATASLDTLLATELPDLRSRFRAAYRLATDTLDDDGKLEVIRLKAERRGFTMSAEVCRFILSRARRDMHHLARLVARLDEETMSHQKKVTIPFVKASLDL